MEKILNVGNLDIVKQYAKSMNPSSNNEIGNFINMLSPEERIEYEAIEDSSESEKFINRIIVNRTSSLKAKMGDISVDKYIVSDIMDLTTENLKDYAESKTTEQMELELETGIKAIKRHYINEATKIFVTNRGKVDFEGNLDYLISIEEYSNIESTVNKKLMDNPTYKMSLLFINNSAGSITVFNDKMIESRRDYEIYKELYCNEKGMTVESFDNWQEYVKMSIKMECIDGDGFSNLEKFDKEWHKETLKKFFKKVPDFKPGETIVYVSDFLKELDNMEVEKDKTAKSQLMLNILEDLDNGIKKGVKATWERELPSSTIAQPEKKVVNAIKDKKKALTNRINKPLKEESELSTGKKDQTSIFDMVETEKTEVTEVVKESEIVNVETVQVAEEVKSEYKPTVYDTTIIVEEVKDVDKKLEVFRSKKIEETVLVRYEKDPDPSILKSTIVNPKVRLQAYKDSAIKNGFRIYLPYSGYEVIVKKLLDKSKISYLINLIENSEGSDIETIVEQETFKILYECLEFPNMEYVSYSEFTKSLSDGDVPILMVALAMTNIPENKNGRVTLPIRSLRCTDSKCPHSFISIDPISIDLKDLFSKIYPIKLYVDDYQNRLKNITSISKAFRMSSTGKLLSITQTDTDGICKYTVLLSKPTVYKNYSVANQEADVNFNLIRTDILERPNFYFSKIGVENLEEYVSKLTFSEFKDKLNNMTAKVAMLQQNASEFTEEETKIISDEIQVDMTPITVLNNLVMNNALGLQKLLKICRYIDAIKVTTLDGDEITSVENHDDLYSLVELVSQLPNTMLEKLYDEIEKIGDTFIYEHENVFYESDEIKGKVDQELLSRFSPNSDDAFISFMKNRHPNITPERIDIELQERKLEYENLKEGKCACGNEHFFINYINIVFFSMSNKLEVILK
ncbi:MAG: hypothetical protein ACRCX2_20195 [Paraclostridium sp.]